MLRRTASCATLAQIQDQLNLLGHWPSIKHIKATQGAPSGNAQGYVTLADPHEAIACLRAVYHGYRVQDSVCSNAHCALCCEFNGTYWCFGSGMMAI